ncbi:helicase-associated domain-containing protein [Nostoc sp. FACHB-110]|uniref:helicase-associated domain-containing protein n=1 Tax=Nostoc sp. FACHB-110 TaxID=2692834 RepID=UPI00168746EC|nr:helicase-associated domain-containing protein [Nostoc sp. FACHB-110]MBD2436442.1 helicase-associated domain-containing protein [Nostoc sp. FACHB-110]
MPYYQDQLSITTVDEALQQLSVDELKKLAALLNTNSKPTRKAEIIAVIHRYLVGENLQQLWRELDHLQQKAVAETIYNTDGLFNATSFYAKYLEEPNWGTSDVYGYKRQPSLLCLFIYSNIIPQDLQTRLKAFVSPPAEFSITSLDKCPEVFRLQWQQWNWKTRERETHEKEIVVKQCEMETAAQQDLLAVLRLINAGKLSVSDKTGYPNNSSMSAIASVLTGGDYYNDDPSTPSYEKIGFIKPFAWAMLVQAAGLAELSSKRLVLTKTGQKALTNPPAATIRNIWKKWLKNKVLDELRRIDSIKGQTGKGKQGLTAPDKRREAITKALAECPVGRWMGVNELFRCILAKGYNFEVTRNLWNLYISDSHYGSLGNGGDDWEILQGRYALCLLFEYVATLGMINIAYVNPGGVRPDYTDLWGTDDLPFLSRYDGLMCLQLTPLGAYCLGLQNDYTPPPLEVRAVFRVLPNLEIAATGEPLTPADTLVLDVYAQKISDAVWRLETAKLLGAIEAGQSITQLREFLQARSGHELPETVNQFLADIEARGNSLRDRGQARLIECTDAALAVLIANDSRTKKLCFLAGEKHLVVPSESETKFRNAVKKLGYSIALSG